jgi:regulator of protease activity HflC (stomatin/prohibitin superfamily)
LEEGIKVFTPVAIMVLCAIAALLAVSIKRIPEGQAYTLRRIDGRLRTVGAGLHLVLPLVERVLHKIRLFGNVVDIGEIPTPEHGAVHGKIYYQVLDASRADAIIDEVGERVCERLPELIAAAPAPDVATRSLHLKTELNRSLRERGLLVTRVQLA